ncbi:uncharacterized protein LOC107048844 [Diachasma alloeum]|uniref:uncharacterized protein LOC107048844 n=1 Tax=Diachasma alloeum TaxID=454923 RepID=UPI0010FB5F67|nr:uncharacterized protein LOC107048844 [Diachasma alloeum]
MIILFLIVVRILEASGEECYYDGNDFCLSPDDILSFDLLPGTFLLDATNRNEKIGTEAAVENVTVDGTYEEALNKMEYHRKRMNEYLCHGFIAEEIFREVKSTRVKRLEDPSANSMPDFIGEENVTVHDMLLSDEGSSKYKEWLQRTTTLDDVYRHYMPKKVHKKISKKGIPHNFEQFDGEVTGYAMPAPMAPIAPGKIGSFYDDGEEFISSPTGHHQFSQPPTGHQYSHPPPPPPPSYHHPSHSDLVPIIHEEHYYEADHEDDSWHDVSWKGKGELTITDFFEIALTALAFLAFGLFIIQLLMSITNAGTTTATVVANATIRLKRNAFSSKFGYNNNAELNELAHRVLRSIEAAMVAEHDAGRCLRWTLCRDNQHSRNMNTAQKVWLPVWSLGMSWLCGRMFRQGTWPVMFDSIKASILGLGGANCDDLYPGCNLADERRKRRRRRRK